MSAEDLSKDQMRAVPSTGLTSLFNSINAKKAQVEAKIASVKA